MVNECAQPRLLDAITMPQACMTVTERILKGIVLQIKQMTPSEIRSISILIPWKASQLRALKR
jgi:hypothetical protein